MTVREVRICVVGDELSVGVGDPRALAVPGETTSGLSARWETETATRFGPQAECENRLVIALGRHDVDADLSIARSRLNLANVLDVATNAGTPCFVVGPPPGRPEDAPRIEEFSAAFADVASRRRVPYVDTFGPLAHHEQWLADLAQNGSLYPGQAGYGLMAWLVLHTGWHAWLGLPGEE